MSADDKPPKRLLSPEQTRLNILAVAGEEFAELGLSGARVDAIAARTRTTKRMIYYYFGSKEGLYVAVLERAYAAIREVEKTLALDEMEPVDGIVHLIEFTFDYQEAHPEFIRLVSIENIHRARYLSESDTIRALSAPIIDSLTNLLARGRAAGLFRADVTAIDVHMLISAFCFFRVSNRHTFGALFDQDFAAIDTRARHKRLIVEAVLGLLDVRANTRAERHAA
jgi:AcrR family transcriptional regulator